VSEYLFVYGTLLPGAAPSEIAAAAAQLMLVSKGWVQGTLFDLGDFPGAILESASGRRIAGTIFRLPGNPLVLQALDAYEEFDPAAPEQSQFLRVRTTVELAAELRADLGAGRALECWIYILNREVKNARLVEDGDWMGRKLNTS
jgi:gamma-glutamylcyclotransferase (GGCT)/AIG2-like uncharacterized protein YtfP